MLKYWSIAAIFFLPSLASAQRPPIERPTNPATVLEHLPPGYAVIEKASASRPTLSLIDELMVTAARTGDARLATRAEKMLDRLPASSQPQAVRSLRAFALQHRHDFEAAIKQLDMVLAVQPSDASARYARAQIQLVRGRVDLARADCGTLALRIDAALGSLCLASVALRTGDYANALALTDRWMHAANAPPAYLRHVLVINAEAASRMGKADADVRFKRALAIDRNDVRTIAAYARHLRGASRPADAVDLLGDAPMTDALLFQHALAAHEARDKTASRLAARLSRRYARAHAVGAEPELRDEAEYLLTIKKDRPRALALALRNFKTQRDYEDVQLLQRAAAAAKRPDALRELHQWARSQRLALRPSL